MIFFYLYLAVCSISFSFAFKEWYFAPKSFRYPALFVSKNEEIVVSVVDQSYEKGEGITIIDSISASKTRGT
jgi:hypothetical protein